MRYDLLLRVVFGPLKGLEKSPRLSKASTHFETHTVNALVEGNDSFLEQSDLVSWLFHRDIEMLPKSFKVLANLSLDVTIHLGESRVDMMQ
jgi:hypothetical protein